MALLVNRKFAEWTEGLDTRQAMISIFEHIRDIPYVIDTEPGLHDPQRGPELLLASGCGSCAPKHHLLAMMYRMLNVSVVYATFPFLWNDPDIRYPPHLRELATGLPVAYHLACRVQAGCRWVLVDATWDPPLERAGFPVNLDWDGCGDTKCAVKPLGSPVRTAFCRTLSNEPYREPDQAVLLPADGEKDHWEALDRERYYSGKILSRTPSDRERMRQFYRGLSAWLEQVRRDENEMR